LGAEPDNGRWLDGLRVLVTGAAGGLGRALVAEADLRGARVAATGRRPNIDTADLPEAAIRVPADLRNPDECRRLVHDAAEQLGGLDIVVNNAAALVCKPADDLAYRRRADPDPAVAELLDAVGEVGDVHERVGLLDALAHQVDEVRATAEVLRSRGP